MEKFGMECLKNIKASFYFINKIFSMIDEKQKLKLVRYNKGYQCILNINITNYKFFSDRYIIFEKNGKGKNMIIIMINYYLRENIQMEKEMEKEKNMI